MYDQYKTLLNKQSQLERQIAKVVLRGGDKAALSVEYARTKQELQALSDAMTFATPRIWIEYKYRAYAEEAQPIRTMHDFRVHCSKPGYICTKRFVFLNKSLQQNGRTGLDNRSAYPDSMVLQEVLAAGDLAELENDEEFMTAWSQHEYFMDDGRVAKWENFRQD